LGWDAKRGREHLKATYSKRSRQELNETELYDRPAANVGTAL